MAKPIEGIKPFDGKAAKWLSGYLRNTKVDPEKQRQVNARIRQGAKRVRPIVRV